MRSFYFLMLLPALAQGQGRSTMEPGPKSPLDSHKCIQTRTGFQVELVACEPAVMDPIAFAWGADGKFWVVEMGDYPLGAGAKDKKGGRIKILEKSKPGGMYDKATVFLDNLGYPTGVFPWKKGVLITCAPDILYAEDTNADGKADKVEKLYTGFREGNQQHRVNGLVWGLDNWIYGANGDSGGTIKSIKTGKEVNINGRDFRINPENGDIEAVTGQSQFGRARDDWGNWFGNNNSNPMFHYVLEDRYLRRNPALLFTDVRVNVSETPGAARVYPISKPLPRFNTPAGLNHFTSACSTIIYRDDLFGPDFEGNSFVAEPVHNLIHREIMRSEGLTFRSKRADDEKESEFLASSDNWFRPTMIQTGPDGALWIADMYRYVIEHPEWIPKEWQAKLDLRAGHDKGRIYRVFPKGKKPREIPNLAKLDLKGLVAALDSPSGWQRDMAHQMMVTSLRNTVNQDFLLAAMKNKRPQTRLHSSMILNGLGRAKSDYILAGIHDSHPSVQKHGILCYENYSSNLTEEQLADRFERQISKIDPHVRLQLAYTMGEITNRQAAVLLLKLAAHAQRAKENRHLLTAVLSSINQTTAPQLLALSNAGYQNFPESVVETLIRFTLLQKKDVPLYLFARLIRGNTTDDMVSMAMICDTLESKNSSFKDAIMSIDVAMRDKLNSVFENARRIANNPKATLAERIAAVRLLGRGITHEREDMGQLNGLLVPATPDEVQQAVLQHLTRVGENQTPTMLIKKWKHFTPNVRGTAFDTLTARPEWTEVTLVHLEAKSILPSELDAVRRQRLLNHRDKSTRVRAEKLFLSTTSKDRAKVINDYLLALTLEGDAKKGAKVFMKSCATCHRVGDMGQDVGPELASVGDKTPGGLLNAILDPNRAVESRYLNYLAATKAGVTHIGILAAETSTSITLVAVDGKKTDILRGDLEELTSTGKSAMPEGLEKDISPREMADLLAFLTRTLPPKLERSTK